MSLASKYIFDPLKAFFAGHDNVLAALGPAQTQVDTAVAAIVTKVVDFTADLLPAEPGLKIEILSDIIAGLEDARTNISTASVVNPAGNVAQAAAAGQPIR